ncbi:hypothetical protein IFM89_026200 [Coptis chinensis]|uniref:Uncharacterized protein n=1 Tax=Coptis chinensis TaxID=261450 RepID=A0A835M135_9MAGN|nr:hypothetical protein IFM89_026200 [Coptis chinensis]
MIAIEEMVGMDVLCGDKTGTLTTEQALGERNLIEESKFLKLLGFMWNPFSWVMEANAIMAIALANGGVLRDGKWNEEDAAVLVPGDVIKIKTWRHSTSRCCSSPRGRHC